MCCCCRRFVTFLCHKSLHFLPSGARLSRGCSLQLLCYKPKRSGLKGGGDMPVFMNVQQLHTLLAFAHRAHFVHGDCEFEELVLSVICFLPGSWISSSKWSERSDSLAELLSWLLHSCWKSQSSVTSRSKTVISLVTWITSQPPIVKDSVAYLLSNMLVAVWRWLSLINVN